MPWWGNIDEASPRMVLEVKVMKEHFAKGKKREIDMQVHWDEPFWVKSEGLESGFDEENRFYWLLHLRFGRKRLWSRKTEWEEEAWIVKIVYPAGYPSQGPTAYIVRPRLFIPLHTLLDGALCLYNPKDGRGYGWDPSKGTGATIALWAIQWIRAYRYYQEYYDWPGPEHSVY